MFAKFEKELNGGSRGTMREMEGGGLHLEKIAVGRRSRLAGPLGASLTPSMLLSPWG